MKKRLLSVFLCLTLLATNLISCGFMDRNSDSENNGQMNPPPQINTDSNNDQNESGNNNSETDSKCDKDGHSWVFDQTIKMRGHMS